jgi:hypothetical protein
MRMWSVLPIFAMSTPTGESLLCFTPPAILGRLGRGYALFTKCLEEGVFSEVRMYQFRSCKLGPR